MEPFPRVGIAPQREFRGVDSLHPRAGDLRAPPKPLQCVPFEHVFLPPWTVQGARPWPTDAHFCTYKVVDPSQPPGTEIWYRCNMPVLRELREVGCDLLTTMLVFDYDNPGKRRWAPGEVKAFADYLTARQQAGFWLGMHWTVWYTTTHGARFVYVLTKPIPVDTAEPLIAGIERDFLSQNIRLDPNCRDWTRLFRAPYVARKFEKGREGSPGYLTWRENTWQEPNFDTHCFPDNRLDAAWIIPGESKPHGVAIAAEELNLPKPDNNVIGLLKEVAPGTGRSIATQWYKTAKITLANRDCWGCIFETKPLAQPGGRDNTIQSYVGQACALLGRVEGSQPELIYALFLPAVLILEPDAQTPDWTDVLWRAVLRYWAKEDARIREELANKEVEVIQAATLGQQVLMGMRKWCKHPSLHADTEAESLAWMSEHMIACASGHHYFVMTPSGRYDTIAITDKQIVARVRTLGMEALIPTTCMRADNQGQRALSAVELVNAHGTIVTEIEGVAGGEGSYIRSIDAEEATLCLRLYSRRTDLIAEFDPEIDHWFRLLFGVNYERGTEWLAHALAIEDGPICAMSIYGSAGCGKQMLALGLSECFTNESLAGGEEFGKYQSGLLRTPIVCVNEGFHQDRDGRDLADSFRALVSGDPIKVNEKFKPRMEIRAPVRILITANDDDAVNFLTAHRDLTEYGREAIALRLLHFKVGHDARLWLIGKGGLGYTSMPGRRWVRSQSGGESNYKLAKHLMYLYENRKPPMRGSRLLVQGKVDSDVEKLMRTRSGSAPEVIETIIAMIESNTLGIEGISMNKQSGEVFVTLNGVQRFHRTLRQALGTKNIHQKAFTNVIKSLAMPGDEDEKPRELMTSTGAKVRARWHELDTKVLVAEAMTLGYQCAKLTMLAATRYGTNKYIGQNVQEIARSMGVLAP